MQINSTVSAVADNTIIVVNIHNITIFNILPFKAPNEVINPTEAGMKKKAKWSKKKLESVSIFSTFNILEFSNKNNNIIPIIFPGTGRFNSLEIISPAK